MVFLQHESLNRFHGLLDGTGAAEQASYADKRLPGVSIGAQHARVLAERPAHDLRLAPSPGHRTSRIYSGFSHAPTTDRVTSPVP
jgi:hypothetical protein